MESQLAKVLQIIEGPAFLASDRADLLYMNEEMRRLVGAGKTSLPRSLIGLGIFENQAEFRGFLRGFNTVGPVQQVSLPSTRLREPAREVLLRAVLLKEEGLILGTVTISEATLPLDKDASAPTLELLDHLPQMVLITDGSGKISYFNHSAGRLLPVRENESRPVEYSLKRIDVEFSEVVWNESLLNARQKGSWQYETHFLRRTGSLMPVAVEICAVQGFPVRTAVLVATDITRSRQRDQQLQAVKLELENLQFQHERDKAFLRDAFGKPTGLEAIVHGNSVYNRVIEQINLVARTDSTVLITGETGTGKELVARAIHTGSRRAREPLVVVNCGALPKELIESELFGFRKGAFTGASRNQTGRFELADGGTLFLDEIGEMPLSLQTRLLRFLQEGEFMPIGSSEPVYVNVRIVAATNRDLDAMVRNGEFRADLYFRLNVFPIHNPPLRERREDIPLLVAHFIKKHGRRLNAEVEKASPETLAELMEYPFYGNIRELENIVERALITCKGKLLTLDWSIRSQVQAPSRNEKEEPYLSQPLKEEALLTLEELQRQHIERVLEITNGKVSGAGGAAKILGLNPQTLFSKIRKLRVKR